MEKLIFGVEKINKILKISKETFEALTGVGKKTTPKIAQILYKKYGKNINLSKSSALEFLEYAYLEFYNKTLKDGNFENENQVFRDFKKILEKFLAQNIRGNLEYKKSSFHYFIWGKDLEN